MPPEAFNLMAMMSNPMMLLMVFGGGMMLAMPYVMVSVMSPFQYSKRTQRKSIQKNLDSDAMEELKDQPARVKGKSYNGDLKAGYGLRFCLRLIQADSYFTGCLRLYQ